MKKLFSYLKDYRKESILGPLFKLLEAFFELIVPLVVAAIIDTGIGQGNRGYIVRMCLALVALGLIGLLCSVTAQYFAARPPWASPRSCGTRCLPISRASRIKRWTPWAPLPSSPA